MTNITTPRPKINLKPRPLDLTRAAAHLLSRAEWLRRRREPDPRCRAVQLADAAECCRLAAALTGGKK